MKRLKALCILCLGFLGANVALAQSDVSVVNENYFYAENIDLMTDEDSSFVYTTEVDPEIEGREGNLVWRCQAGQLTFFIRAAEFLNSTGGDVYVRFRFDKEEPQEWQVWTAATTSQAASAPPEFIEPINSWMDSSEQVIFQVESYTGEAFTYVFNITGFDEAVSELSCVNG